jgi:hypothetical protein
MRTSLFGHSLVNRFSSMFRALIPRISGLGLQEVID